MIDRRLDDNLIASLGQSVDNHSNTLHNAGDVTHPLALYGPAVALTNPVDDALPIAIVLNRIAHYGVIETLAKSLDYKVGCLEIHIRHPQRQQVGLPEKLLQSVVLHAVRAATIDGFVKVVNLHIVRSLKISSHPLHRHNPTA